MLEKIDVKKADVGKYKIEYDRAIWVTPIQIDSFDNVYMVERSGKPIMLVNVLMSERVATIFLCILCKDHLYDCMTMVLKVIKSRWNSVSRVETYIWEEKDREELRGALQGFETEVRYRKHIRIDDKLRDILLVTKYI